MSKSAFFQGGGYFEWKFQMEGASPTNHGWCQETRVIALSCGIKISAVHCVLLSQSTRMRDEQTDRQTEYGWTDRIMTASTALAQLLTRQVKMKRYIQVRQH